MSIGKTFKIEMNGSVLNINIEFCYIQISTSISSIQLYERSPVESELSCMLCK